MNINLVNNKLFVVLLVIICIFTSVISTYFLGEKALIFSFLFLIFVIFYRKVFQLILVFILLLPAEVLLQTGSGATYLRYLGLLIAVLWSVELIINKRFDLKKISFGFIYLLYIAWAGLSVLWSRYPNLVLDILPTYLQLGLFFIIVIDQIRSEKDLEWVVSALVLGSIIAVIIGVVFGRFDPSRYGGSRLIITDEQRGTTSFGYPLAFSLVVLAVYSLISDGRKRLISSVFFILGLYPLILIGLRGAIITVAVGCIGAVIFTVNNPKNVFRLILIIIILFGSIEYLRSSDYLPEDLSHHLSLEELQESGGSGRVTILRAGLEIFKDYPFFGLGLNQMHKLSYRLGYLSREKGAHNDYLNALVELGIPGFLLLLIGDIVCLFNLFKKRKNFI